MCQTMNRGAADVHVAHPAQRDQSASAHSNPNAAGPKSRLFPRKYLISSTFFPRPQRITQTRHLQHGTFNPLCTAYPSLISRGLRKFTALPRIFFRGIPTDPFPAFGGTSSSSSTNATSTSRRDIHPIIGPWYLVCTANR